MRIYLVRHGLAEPSAGSDDTARALTAKGRNRVAQIARGLRKLQAHPGLILTSPLRRAQETAVILARGLGSIGLAELPELAPGAASAAEVRQALAGYHDLAELMLVGHLPDLSHLASYLLTGLDRSCELEFKKGATACFQADSPDALRFSLGWLLQPRVLRRL